MHIPIKENRLPLLVATVHWCISFFTDRLIFIDLPGKSPYEYAACKLIFLALLFLLWRAILKPNHNTWAILKYAGIYLIPITAVLIFNLPQGFLSNDEKLIFEQAAAVENYTWFYYLTTWYYIISMMLIPSSYGPILVKVAIQLFICGYTVYRLSNYLNFKYGKFIYLAFLLPPVLAYTTSAHRIPIYFLIYLFLLFSILMDKLEKREIGSWKLFWVLLLGAFVTQWRTEGIYFAIVLPILMLIAYPSLREKKALIRLLILSFFIQYIVSIPQNGILPGRMQDKAMNRMGPFYAYTITNMYRNGLDKEKNKDSLNKIGRYLNLSVLDAINRDLKDINYEDVLILYYPGYVGTIEGADDDDYRVYVEGCKEVFFNNPDVFLRTRAGAFNYAATPYHISLDENSLKGYALFFVSIVKTLAYNLYIPHLLLLLFLILSLFKRWWFGFFLFSGLCCHFAIVFILAPASYFKYYFPIYMISYFSLLLSAILFAWRRKHIE
ncbi:MAG: hypothetical protein J6O55_07005 [Lachnospiraceae bacterium]|nr:hypothetical protein [Lachnospiraceae bacterium]